MKNKIKTEAIKIIENIQNKEGLVRYTFRGKCMFPILKDQDLVFVRPLDITNLKAGDIILFCVDDVNYIHRFLYFKKIGNKFEITTKPDNSWKSDPVFNEENFIGKIESVKRDKKITNLSTPYKKIISLIIGLLSIAELFSYRLYTKYNPKVPKTAFKYIKKILKTPKNVFVKLHR